MANYTTDSTVFQVKKEYPDLANDKPNWYEYEVSLLLNGKVVDTFSSLSESYIEGQELTKAKAKAAVKEIETDVTNGKAERWFSLA